MTSSLPAFTEPAIEGSAIRLTVETGGRLDERIQAFVNGIVVGQGDLVGPLEAGATLRIACDRFPHTSLPAEVRFGTSAGSRDVAPPLVVTTAAQVLQIVGSGEFVNTSLRMADGILTGTAVNAANGLCQPVLVGRINGQTFREVHCRPIGPRDEGGGVVRYQMRVEATDLVSSGARFEILVAPAFTVLATYGFVRDSVEGDAGLVARLEAGLRNLEKRLELETVRTARDFATLRREILAKDDALIEYVTAIAFDTAAGGPRPSIAARPPGLDATFTPLDADRYRFLRIGPASRWFASGWESEIVDVFDTPCRRFAVHGVVLNPRNRQKVVRVEFAVLSAERAGLPAITALFDGKEMPVTVVASEGGVPFSVRIEPAEPMPVTLLRLFNTEASLKDGVPHTLGIAIADLTFCYDPSPVEDAPA